MRLHPVIAWAALAAIVALGVGVPAALLVAGSISADRNEQAKCQSLGGRIVAIDRGKACVIIANAT